jgi:hypothetical protein
VTQPDYQRLAVEHREAVALHAAKLREYSAAPPRSPEADRAWREAQAASDAAQLDARMMRGGR